HQRAAVGREVEKLRAGWESNRTRRSRTQVPKLRLTCEVARCQKKFIRTRDGGGQPRALCGELVLHHVIHGVADGQVAMLIVGPVKSEAWAEIERVPVRCLGPLLERAEVCECEAGDGFVSKVETVGTGGSASHF